MNPNQQPTAAAPQSAPSRALAEAMAAHFDGCEQSVPYGAQWDGAGLEADARLRQPATVYRALG